QFEPKLYFSDPSLELFYWSHLEQSILTSPIIDLISPTESVNQSEIHQLYLNQQQKIRNQIWGAIQSYLHKPKASLVKQYLANNMPLQKMSITKNSIYFGWDHFFALNKQNLKHWIEKNSGL